MLDRYARGESLDPFLTAYAGFNALRVWPYVPVKDWGAKAWDSPAPNVVCEFVAAMGQRGWYVELTLLTDDDSARIEPAKALVSALAAANLPNVFVEIGNEPTTHKNIDTRALKAACDASGLLYSSGNYEDVRQWFGRFGTVHTKRQSDWPRYSHDLYEWYTGAGPEFPWAGAKCPIVGDEPPKPGDVGMTIADALAYFGGLSIFAVGGTWHCETAKYAKPPEGDEIPLAAAALTALNAFPADAPLGRYRRIVEPGNEEGGPTEKSRTYVVGDCMVRSQQRGTSAPESGWTAIDDAGILWKR